MRKAIVSEKFNDKYMLVTVGIVIFMLYSRDLFDVNISSIVFTVISIALAFPMRYNEFMCYLFFLFPLGNGLPGSYMMPLLAVLWILKTNNFPSKNTLAFWALIALSEFFHYESYQFESNPLMIIRYLSCFFLFIVSISDISSYRHHNYRALFYVIGTITVVVCIIIRTYLMGAIESNYFTRVGELENIDESLEGRIMLSMNPNSMAFLAVTTMAICQFFYSKRTFEKRWFLTVASIIAFLAVLLSLSRSGFFAVILLLFLYSLSTIGNNYIKPLIVFGAAFAGIFLWLEDLGLVEQLMDRFADETTNTAGDRTSVLEKYNVFLINNPIYLWVGTGAVYYRTVAGVETSTHNAIQQILVSYGIFGLSIFVYAAFKLSRVFKKVSFMAWIPVFVVLFDMQAIQFLIPTLLLFPIVAAFEVVKGFEPK